MPDVDPKVKKKIQAYTGIISNFLHGNQTKRQVEAMLQSAPPETSIPQTALTVNAQVEGALRERGEEPALDVRLAGGVHLVSSLIEIGNAGGFWPEISLEDGLATYLEPTMKEYIHNGIKNGTVDPVELQQSVEPLMNEEEKSLGMKGAEAAGVPKEPGQQAAMEKYANTKVREIKKKQDMQSRMGTAQAQPQGGMV